jgi:hypothetical protein
VNYPGFNCGEAVNFAIGDWFPLGALASKRYAHLNRTPLLSHEELLCRSAVLLSQKLLICDLKSLDKSEHPYSQYCLKSSFVRLMRFHQRARGLLAKMGSQICYKRKTYPNLSCSMCRRDCYITHVLCGCNFDPVCLHHGNSDEHCNFCRFLFTFLLAYLIVLIGMQSKRCGAAIVSPTEFSMLERT